MSYRREVRHVLLVHPDGTREYSILFLNPGETVEECLKRNGLEGVAVEEGVTFGTTLIKSDGDE